MSNEAWKDTGNCAECRRARYCNKQCTAYKRLTEKESKRRAQAILAATSREDMMREILKSMRRNPPSIKRKIMVHGAMVYGCQDCGSQWVMYLERGLEEACEDRKPVPFGIICPFCKGFHAYDISGYLPLPNTKYAELPEGESCFENRPDRDCGTPRIANPPRRL